MSVGTESPYVDVTGPLSIQGGFSNVGAIDIESTSAINLSHPTINNGTINLYGGSVTDAGTFTNNGVFSWSSGSLPQTVENLGTMTIVGTGSKSVGWATNLENNGVITEVGGSTTVVDLGGWYSNSCSISNLAGGVYDLQGDGGIQASANSNNNYVNNAGTFKKSASTGTSVIGSGITFTNTGTVEVDSGTLELDGGGISTGGNLVANGSGCLVINGLAISGTNTISGSGAVLFTNQLNNNDTLRVGRSSTAIVQGGLINSGTIDLGGKLIVDYSGQSPIHSIASQISSGYANGAWNGIGIDSSDAAADHQYMIGYEDDGSSVTIQLALAGDSDLDGTVDSNDFSLLAANYGKTSATWDQGDYNYDGTVNALDFNALASNYGQSLSADVSDVSLPFASAFVPEPAVAIMPILLALSVRRRKTKQTSHRF